MDDGTTTRWDRIESIRKASWESYRNRREYEWKISFGVWAALLALLHVLLNRDSLFRTDAAAQPFLETPWLCLCRYQTLQLGIALLSISILWLHVQFMRFVRNGHFIDQTRHEDCLKWQRRQTKWSDSREVRYLVKDVQQKRFRWRKGALLLRWVPAHKFQIWVTVVILFSINLLLWIVAP